MTERADVGPRALGAGRADVEAAFGVLWRHLVVQDPPTSSDALLCFGSRDRRVPARAAELWSEGVAPLVMVSGGGLLDGDRCEADVFADDLVARGVPAERVVREREARNTGENVTFGVRGLEVHVRLRRITAVSWPLAARRCRATLGRHHPTVAVTSAPALAHPDEVWPATPRAVRAALGEWDRLAAYVGRGFTVAQPRPLEVCRAVGILRTALAVDGSGLGAHRGEGAGVGPRAGATATAAFR